MRYITVLMAALCSTFAYVKADELWAAPGALFGLAVIAYTLVKKYPVKAWSLAGYLFCMSIVFIALFAGTAAMGFIGLIGGIFTCGFGSMAAFFLTRQFVCDQMKYKPGLVFLWGSLVFAVNLVAIMFLELPFGSGPEISRAMAPVIFFWQICTGFYLLSCVDQGFRYAKKP